jgi:hypothetical protein
MRSVVFPVGPAGGAERSEECVLRFMRAQNWNATDAVQRLLWQPTIHFNMRPAETAAQCEGNRLRALTCFSTFVRCQRSSASRNATNRPDDASIPVFLAAATPRMGVDRRRIRESLRPRGSLTGSGRAISVRHPDLGP